MSQGSQKLQAIQRLVALRKRMEEQAQANLRKVQLDMAQTEALLQTPWAINDAPRRAQDLEGMQALRDVGYVRLADQQGEAETLQGELQHKHRELRQVEVLHEHAQNERKQKMDRRDARDTENWLRRRKDTEGT